jgi:hypothetical protein
MYSELEKWLLDLGFSTLPTSGEQKVFQHSLTKALIVLPNYDAKAFVHVVHLAAVRRILIENGLVNENDFSEFLEKVPS